MEHILRYFLVLVIFVGAIFQVVSAAGSLFHIKDVGSLPYFSPNYSYLFYADTKGVYVAYDIIKQTQFWNVTLKGKVTQLGEGALCQQGNAGVAVQLEGGTVVCLSGIDGSTVWTSGKTLPKGKNKTQPLTDPGIVGWGGGGTVSLVDPIKGTLQAVKSFQGTPQCQPQVVNVTLTNGGHSFSLAAQMKGAGINEVGVSDTRFSLKYAQIQGNTSGCLAYGNDYNIGAQNLYTTSPEGFFTILNPSTLKRWYVDNATQSDPPVAITNRLVAYKNFQGQTVILGATNSSNIRSYSDNGQGVNVLGDWDAGGEVKVAMALTTTTQQSFLHVVTVGGKVSTFLINQGLLTKQYDFQIDGGKNYTIYPIVALNKRFFVTSDDGQTDVMNYDGSTPESGRKQLLPNSPGVYAGIAIGAIAFLGILFFLIFKLRRVYKNKRQRRLEEEFKKQQDKKEKELDGKENKEDELNLNKDSVDQAPRSFALNSKPTKSRKIDDLESQNTKIMSMKTKKDKNLNTQGTGITNLTGASKDRGVKDRGLFTGSDYDKPSTKLQNDDSHQMNLRSDNGYVFSDRKKSTSTKSIQSNKKLINSKDATDTLSPGAGLDKHQILKSLESEDRSAVDKKRRTQTLDSQNLDNFDQLEDHNDINTRETLKSIDTQKSRSPKAKDKTTDREIGFETPQLKFGGSQKATDSFEFANDNTRDRSRPRSSSRQDAPPPSYEQMLKDQALKEYKQKNRSQSSLDHLKDQRQFSRRSSSRQGGQPYRPSTSHQRSDSADLMRNASRPYSQQHHYGHPQYRQHSPPVYYNPPYGQGPPPNQSAFYHEPPPPPLDPRYHSGQLPQPYMYDRQSPQPYPYGYR